mmetsp:Transcript_106325/g.300820  ORF Transcript_106325/g.300820 Transcript_106325/m.300820 type:complete len:225 (+) Transcript_106325:105-779(+)
MESLRRRVTQSPIAENSGIYKLHLTAEATLNSEGVRASVRLPPGVAPDEWIAAQFLGLYTESALLLEVLEDFCTCDCMCAGKDVQYTWMDEATGRSLSLTAVDYTRELTAAIRTLLSNRALVPQDGTPFPREFRPLATRLLKRLFRLYAHCYIHHFSEFRRFEAEAYLNLCFKHFLFFVLEFDLVSKMDMAPLSTLIKRFESSAAPEPASSSSPPEPTYADPLI